MVNLNKLISERVKEIILELGKNQPVDCEVYHNNRIVFDTVGRWIIELILRKYETLECEHYKWVAL